MVYTEHEYVIKINRSPFWFQNHIVQSIDT